MPSASAASAAIAVIGMPVPSETIASASRSPVPAPVHGAGRRSAAQHEAGDRQDDQHADDRAQEPAEVEHVVVADAEQAGEDRVADCRTGEPEQQRDQP